MQCLKKQRFLSSAWFVFKCCCAITSLWVNNAVHCFCTLLFTSLLLVDWAYWLTGRKTSNYLLLYSCSRNIWRSRFFFHLHDLFQNAVVILLYWKLIMLYVVSSYQVIVKCLMSDFVKKKKISCTALHCFFILSYCYVFGVRFFIYFFFSCTTVHCFSY